MEDDKLKTLAETRKRAHRKLLESGSRTYRAFVEMEEAAFGDGAHLQEMGTETRATCRASARTFRTIAAFT